MAESHLPPGMRYNPSEWPRRLPGVALAVAGCCIATYLALYQTGVVAEVWEPFFGNGSRLLLRQSAVARLLPVPDAALGAVAYLAEAILGAVGGRDRWRSAQPLVLAFGGVAFALGAAGVLLVVLQPLLSGTFCTLCLASAACSVTAALAAAPEVLASWRAGKRPVPGDSPKQGMN